MPPTTSAAPDPTSISSFTRLSPTVSLHQPPSFTPTSPTVILAPWLEAPDRINAYYVSQHQRLHPDARILLVRSTYSLFLYTAESHQKGPRVLGPAVAALRAEPRSPVLVHLLSNGGAQQAGLLLRAYMEAAGERLAVRGMVLDSSPSRGWYWDGYPLVELEVWMAVDAAKARARAVRWALVVLGWLVLGAVGLVLALMSLAQALTGWQSMVQTATRDLNEGGVRRAYMYSREDALVKSSDVEWQVRQAKLQGCEVQAVRFEGTAHCRHARGPGEERYWAVVKYMLSD